MSKHAYPPPATVKQWRQFLRDVAEELREVFEKHSDALRHAFEKLHHPDVTPPRLHGPQLPARPPRTHQGACKHTSPRPPHQVAVFRRRTP